MDAEDLQRRPYEGAPITADDLLARGGQHAAAQQFLGGISPDSERDAATRMQQNSAHSRSDSGTSARSQDKAGVDGCQGTTMTKSSCSTQRGGTNASGTQSAPRQSWLREGIRVKVISKRAGQDSSTGGSSRGSSASSNSKYYLQKGVVVDVPERGMATVRMDEGANSSGLMGGGRGGALKQHQTCVLERVQERHLETVLPARGGLCRVLVGEHAGETAHLLERHDEVQQVVVQLAEDLQVVVLPMDSIAACTASA